MLGYPCTHDFSHPCSYSSSYPTFLEFYPISYASILAHTHILSYFSEHTLKPLHASLMTLIQTSTITFLEISRFPSSHACLYPNFSVLTIMKSLNYSVPNLFLLTLPNVIRERDHRRLVAFLWRKHETHFNPLAAGIFFKILAHLVFKMWILQEPKTIALKNKQHLKRKKNGECAACLKYSVSIFVE